MSFVGVVVGGIALAGTIYSADQQRSSGNKARDAQVGAADKGIDEQRRQFDAIQKLLSPYVTAGTGALSGQQDLTGLNGPDAQARAIQQLQASPAFTSAQKTGEDSILARASATGGLRGGNVQAALGQFSPALLSSMINDQYTKLGGIASTGLGAATMTGNAGLNTSNQVTQLLQQQGASTAGAALNAGRATAGYGSAFGQGAGAYFAAGGNPFSQRNPYTTPDPATGYYKNPPGVTGGEIDPFGNLGGAGSASDFSDVRLKTDIEPAGIASNGLPLWRFRYVWGGPRRTGHMAHEVAERFPEAVSRHNGFLMVDYAKV